MFHGCHHQCTSTRDGQDLLKVLIMEATTQEMAVTDTSSINRAKELRGRKTGQSRMPNRTIRFLRRQQQHLVTSRSRGHPMSLPLISWGQSREDTAGERIFGQC
jgi:hypothetical protein